VRFEAVPHALEGLVHGICKFQQAEFVLVDRSEARVPLVLATRVNQM